ncbi:hypothetical protein T07_13015 [Trichinella nelsoni]|uniref:Uncharacterized protein n=1 Tax=Trichinella nelsoni TaxID=6336 RepID=A0A0V0RCH7_9BILA|nr:hypothetical protein T07_13015 [Trichinella nelsoni]
MSCSNNSVRKLISVEHIGVGFLYPDGIKNNVGAVQRL